MAPLTGSLAFDLFAILAAFVAITVAFFKWKFQYWTSRGIVDLEPPIIPIGHLKHFFFGKISRQEMFVNLYREAKARNMKHCGFYVIASPIYIPIDPEIIKCILQKDFDHFMNHGLNGNSSSNDPLNGNLFNLGGAKWRDMRVKLTPTFTSGKMKMMFPILVECGETLRKQIGDNSRAVNIKEVLARFSTDIIGSCAFGLDINSLNDPDSEFRKYGKKIFETTFAKQMRRLALIATPELFTKMLGIKLTDPDVESFFLNMVKNTVKYREESGVERNDFLQLLLQIKNEETDGSEVQGSGETQGLSIEEIAAQCFVFFLAGLETSSTAITWALYELARNPVIQTDLRNEINAVVAKHGGELTYAAVMDMPYLDKVVKETLRMYPSLSALMRKCNKDYKVPGTDLVIEKGTMCRIPVIGVHTDPEYYPDPEKFDPERFSEEEKNKRPPFTYLPFGDGPRQCIGMRFGIMQTKIGVLSLVKNYNIKMNRKTADPMVFSPNTFFMIAKDGVWLDFEKIL